MNAEQLLGEILGSCGGALGFIKYIFDVARTIQVQLCQRDVAQDCGQDIIEVVGDSAGEQPDRFHFRGALDLLFQSQALRDVAKNQHRPNHATGGILDRGEATFDHRISSRVAHQRCSNRQVDEKPFFKNLSQGRGERFA